MMTINRSQLAAAAIAHGSYGGIGIAIYFGLSMLLTTTLFAIFLALLLAMITYLYKERSDTLISVIWAVGMSIGIIFTDLSPGYHADLMSYLFGDILMVPNQDLWFMGGVDLLLIIMTGLLYRQFLAIFYDPEFAQLVGLRVRLLHTLSYILIALTIVMSIRSVGLILVIALFSIPPFIAERFTRTMPGMMLLSSVLGLLFCMAGLFFSYWLDISATPAIILSAATLFFGVLLIKR
ncbi:MAG: hypothetical protein B6D59_05085 [Campylobacteraceae bacterium 4484_4]|nr:MAG: hypothetical protein B6D59_05085 [Campylobacteraceae bacterium 4484_4]